MAGARAGHRRALRTQARRGRLWCGGTATDGPAWDGQGSVLGMSHRNSADVAPSASSAVPAPSRGRSRRNPGLRFGTKEALAGRRRPPGAWPLTVVWAATRGGRSRRPRQTMFHVKRWSWAPSRQHECREGHCQVRPAEGPRANREVWPRARLPPLSGRREKGKFGHRQFRDLFQPGGRPIMPTAL